MATRDLDTTKISTILSRFKSALKDGLGWEEHRIKVKATNVFKPTPVTGNQLIWLHAQPPIPDTMFLGAARDDLVVKRIIEVHLMTYLQFDTVDDEESLLTDSSLGHYETEDSIIDILDHRYLLDTDELNPIIIEPLKYSGPFARDKEIPFAVTKPYEEKWEKWVESIIPYNISYTRTLTSRNDTIVDAV